MTDEKTVKEIAERLQKLCNSFKGCPINETLGHAKLKLDQTLAWYAQQGTILNYNIGNICIDHAANTLVTKIHIQLAGSFNAGVIDIGARTAVTELAIQVPSDGRYEDRWNLIREELEEYNEIIAGKEEHE